MTPEQYWDMMTRIVPGRTRQGETVTVEPYHRGSLLAFAIDLQLRLDTGGRLTFDDLMRYLSREHARGGLTTAGFHKAILQATGRSYGDLFFRYAMTDELPTELFAKGGAELYRP